MGDYEVQSIMQCQSTSCTGHRMIGFLLSTHTGSKRSASILTATYEYCRKRGHSNSYLVRPPEYIEPRSAGGQVFSFGLSDDIMGWESGDTIPVWHPGEGLQCLN